MVAQWQLRLIIAFGLGEIITTVDLAMCLAWEALPVAYTTASIALGIM
jgi:hypothetical protein